MSISDRYHDNAQEVVQSQKIKMAKNAYCNAACLHGLQHFPYKQCRNCRMMSLHYLFIPYDNRLVAYT